LLARTDWTSPETGRDGKNGKPLPPSPKERLRDGNAESFGLNLQTLARKRKEAMRNAARKRRAEYAASRLAAQMPMANPTIEVFETASGIKAYRKTVVRGKPVKFAPAWEATGSGAISLPFVSILHWRGNRNGKGGETAY